MRMHCGMNDSGMGRRHGDEGFLRYTETKTVAEQRGPTVGAPRGVPDGWYAKAMALSLRAMKRIPGVR